VRPEDRRGGPEVAATWASAAGGPEHLDLGHGLVELHARRFVPADGGPIVPLTQREVDLLSYLSRHPGRMIGREELAREVWSEAPEVATRTVDTAIHRLRAKLESSSSAPSDGAVPARSTPSAEPSSKGPRRVLLGGAGEGLRLNLPAHARAAADAAVPHVVGPLIGRDAELAELLALVDAGAELLVVVGEEGSGKSRLAAELALRVAEGGGRVGGARWVRLRGVHTASGLRHAVGTALDVDWLPGEDPDERIRAGLVDTLLVLDALDGPIDAAAELVPRWLGAPGAVVVGTCAAPLLVPRERVVEVRPLPSGAALALFLACASVSGREPTGEEADAVDAIVARTGGNPLAIEIAAIWSALLDPASVLSRIETVHAEARGRVDPLSTVIGGAWQRLTEEERDCLLACSAFPGRFDGRAVAALCDVPARIPAALLGLRRKGLVGSAGGRLLELPLAVRSFVGVARAERGLAADLPARFAQHAWEAATELSDRLIEPSGAGRVDDELGRAVAAVAEIDDPAVRAEVLLALGPALDAAGWCDVHAAWLDRILREGGDPAGAVPADLHGPLLQRRASVLLALGGVGGAAAAIGVAAGAAARDGDPVLRASVALDEATLAGLEGRGEAVLTRTRQAADLVRSAGRGAGDDGRAGPVWMVIGANLMAGGDRAGAEAAYVEVVRNARIEGSHRRAAAAFVRLANLAIDHGDAAQASARVGQAEAELRVIGTRAPTSLLRVRGALAELRGDGPLAEAEWRELAALAMGADEPWARLEAQLGQARCALRRDDLESAWDLLAAAASGARSRWVAGWVEASALLAMVHVRLDRRIEAERICAELAAGRADEARAFVAALIEGAPVPAAPGGALLMMRLRYALAS
jgi:hypothetical protein